MSKLTTWATLALCLGFTACSSDPATFLTYSQRRTAAGGVFDPTKAPVRTDALALNYANAVEGIFRARSTGTRYTREASDTALAGLSAFAGASETLSLSASTLSGMGLAGVGILELRKIFDAKGRSNAYFEAAERIHSAIKDYGAHNLNNVSESQLTPNGWTLVNVVQSNIDIVNKILNGHLPSPEALAQASEPMSDTGATPQRTGTTPVNNIPAGALGVLKAPPPAVSSRRPTNPNAVLGVTKEIPADVQRDQTRLSAWLFERENKGEFSVLRQFLIDSVVTPPAADTDLGDTIRPMIAAATTRDGINPLLERAELEQAVIAKPITGLKKAAPPTVSGRR